jgi:hypothetical protein
MPNHTTYRPYFDAGQLPPSSNAYVAWIDVMGVQSMMSRSLNIASNFVFKLHVAGLEAPHVQLQLYPVMDGIYVVSDRCGPLLVFMEHVFSAIADEFVSTSDIHHRFLIKGAVAFGPVVHGRDIPQPVSNTLHNNADYRNAVLLGMSMVQAHLGERAAPPFGVFIHESARAFAPAGDQSFRHVWWEWFRQHHQALAHELRQELKVYFDWCTVRSGAILYEPDRIDAHRKMAEQYFVDT